MYVKQEWKNHESRIDFETLSYTFKIVWKILRLISWNRLSNWTIRKRNFSNLYLSRKITWIRWAALYITYRLPLKYMHEKLLSPLKYILQLKITLQQFPFMRIMLCEFFCASLYRSYRIVKQRLIGKLLVKFKSID